MLLIISSPTSFGFPAPLSRGSPPLASQFVDLVSLCLYLYVCLVSTVLDCGHTLVGGKKVVQLVCENKGGDGKFCVMRKSCWPSTTFEV